jgi:Ca2+-binding RTX toxin-like protein
MMATFNLINSTSALPTSGSDILAGSQSGDTISAGTGDDVVFGLGGNDVTGGRHGQRV